MKLFVAPLQGYTDAPFRHFHNQFYGGADGYFSPFLRIEKGMPARREMRDILSSLGCGDGFVPQIIFRDAEEFSTLAGTLKDAGFRRIDLNMGCPFPPQVRKGRGAGFLLRPGELAKVAAYVTGDTVVDYSVKMRLGVDAPDQWKPLVAILRDMPLVHVTVHPRTAREQYRGSLHLDSFEEFASTVGKPLVFNGDILSPADISATVERWPWLHGVMVGRGLLARPSIFVEWREGCEWSFDRRREEMFRLHAALLGHYRPLLCGDAQLLARMKSFWEYSELSHRQLKRIGKARSMADYEDAVKCF